MDFTINLIWVILAAAALLVTIIGIIIKSSREAERFESWLKTHEKEIVELKRDNKDINQEHKRLDAMIGGIAISLGKIDTKLEILLGDRWKANQHERTKPTQS